VTENELYALIISTMQSGFTALSVTDIAIKQSYQPDQQGANTGPTIYLHKLSDKRYGSAQVSENYDSLGQKIDHTEKQFMESTFQAMVLATQFPTKPGKPTAADLANMAAYTIQSDAGRAALRTGGAGILRVQQIVNAPIFNDRDRNQFAPAFDFTLEHEQVIISQSNIVETIEYRIDRV
jgi:hypothetical protein